MPIPFPKPSSSTHQSHPNSTPSLPSYASSASSTDDADTDDDKQEEEESAMIQEEWEESLRQMEMVLSIVVIPFFGKWYGRQFAFWAHARYLRIGTLGKAFFGLS